MPTRSKKTYEYPDAQHTVRGTVKRAASISPMPLDVDPPIIIQGGGSVTIYSMYPLEKKDGTPKHPYVYYIAGVDIAEMKWQGKNNQSDKSKNAKEFKLELYK